MKIYLYTPPTDDARLRLSYRQINELLNRAGAAVFTRDTDPASLTPEKTGRRQSLLDRVDAVIIEGTEPDPEVGYLLAYAIAQKRPLLLLTERTRSAANPLAPFGRHQLPATLRISPYRSDTLEKSIVQFLQALDSIDILESPSIKFTLRITPQIERYLEWKTRNTDMSKADFLRLAIIEQLLTKDEAYQQYRRRRKTGDEPAEG